MIDPSEQLDIAKFQPFEGMWLAAKPYHAVTYAKVVNGRLLIPYSSNERKLTGHYYDCHVIDGILYCRFEHFDSAQAGLTFLATGPNATLQGGRWTNDKVSKADIEKAPPWSKTLPGMQSVVWIRILKKPTPTWAEKYFQDDWPNKF